MPGRRENLSLNLVRTLAALTVVLGHTRAYLFVPRNDAPPEVVTQVALAALSVEHGAVLVFFVLSGYFVGGSVIRDYSSRRFKWSVYATSRLVRLWLVLLPALALTAVVDILGKSLFPTALPYSIGGASSGGDSLPVALGNAVFLQPVFVPTFGTNAALWSLTYEAVYYFTFPLLLSFTLIRSRVWRAAALPVVGVAVLIIYGRGVSELFPAWLIGAAVAEFESPLLRFVARINEPWLGLLRLLLTGATFVSMLVDKLQGGSPTHVTTGSYAIAICTALLITTLLPNPLPRVQAFRRPLNVVSRLAHSSYTLYAIHLPLVAFAAAAVGTQYRGRFWQPTALHWLAYIGLVIVLVAIAWLLARVTEDRTTGVRRAVLELARVVKAKTLRAARR